MLNSKNERELFCSVLTHCDQQIDFDGEPKILDDIIEANFSQLVTNEERDGALKIYNQYFMPEIEQYGSVL